MQQAIAREKKKKKKKEHVNGLGTEEGWCVAATALSQTAIEYGVLGGPYLG